MNCSYFVCGISYFENFSPFICLIKFIPKSLRPQKNDEDNERSPPPLKCNSISLLCFFFFFFFFFSWKTIGNNQPQSRDDDDVFWMKLWKSRPDVHHQRRLNEREYRNEWIKNKNKNTFACNFIRLIVYSHTRQHREPKQKKTARPYLSTKTTNESFRWNI